MFGKLQIIMKKLNQIISVVFLSCCALAVNAKPISTSEKGDDSAELRHLESIGYDSAVASLDSTQLKIIGAAEARIFGQDSSAHSNPAFGSRSGRALITQAMTLPVESPSTDLDALDPRGSTGKEQSLIPEENVIVVSEPPVLLLLGFAMLVAAMRRKA